MDISRILALFLTVVITTVRCDNDCAAMPLTIGHTSPKGDIIVQYGNPLEIYCLVNTENVTDLHFKRNDERLDTSVVEVINSTALRLYIEKPYIVDGDIYYCMDGERFICMNVVSVGFPPQNVTDFSCISRNLDNLTCNWTPAQNYIVTNYQLTYHLGKGKTNKNYIYTCPLIVDVNDKKECFWNISTTPSYRFAYDYYMFNISMNNTLGKNKNSFLLNTYSYVIPNAPEKLVVRSTTPHSIMLSWEIPSSMQNFPPGLRHRVAYQSEYGNKEWAVAILTLGKKARIKYNLTNLTYAHALYDIRVSLMSQLSADNFTLWSNNATITNRTASKRPDRPPRTNVGSFEISSNNVFIYWQQLAEYEENGPNFSYHVEIDGNKKLKPEVLNRAYAKFKNLSPDVDHKFKIWSKNSNGLSKNSSAVEIPRSRIPGPTNFAKMDYDHVGLYELSWIPPELPEDEILTSYTIFWCMNEKDRPHQCSGKLNWTEIEPTKTTFNQTVPSQSKIYQFGISANTLTGSSGIVWAECTVIAYQNVGMKTIYIKEIRDTWMDIAWTSYDCSLTYSSVKSYNVSYCPIKSPQQKECKDAPQYKVFKGNESHGVIHDLTPYTTYTVNFTIIGHSGYTQHSVALLNTTLEAAPDSPPLNIEIVDVTNNSINLKWSPPSTSNGKLRFYNVKYNDQELKVDDPITNFKITNLKSFTNYSISLQACTVVCSEPSKTFNVTTQMWAPGEISIDPKMQLFNGSTIDIVWGQAIPAAGKNDYYEIKFVHQPENVTEYLNMTSRKWTIERCNLNAKYNQFHVYVRAVNIINSTSVPGPWSNKLVASCASKINWLVWVLSISSVIIGLLVLYGIQRGYTKCKAMRDVEIKLPPGLTPVTDDNLVPWNAGKHDTIDRHSTADEELSLLKIREGKHASGDVSPDIIPDSSGCSSGHESVTSSIDSGPINSDSGTEQAKLEDLKRNSLRLRNVSTKPIPNKGYVIMPTDSSSAPRQPNQSENYCVFGGDPANTDNVSTDSEFASSEVSSQPPYTLSGDIIKSHNPGYIPYSTEASTAPGYVLAGPSDVNKDLMMQELIPCDPLKPKIAEETSYVKTVENPSKADFLWQAAQQNDTLPKSGYVSVGDARPPQKTVEQRLKKSV